MSGEVEATARGHLAADAEVRYTNSGEEVVSLRLAVGVRRRDAEKGWIDVRTDWLDVAVWNAALAGRVTGLRKGQHVEVRGRLKFGAYIDRDGVPRPSTTLTAFSVTLVPAKVAQLVEAEKVAS